MSDLNSQSNVATTIKHNYRDYIFIFKINRIVFI